MASRKPTRRPRSANRPVPVEALKHKDKRVNIPTEELREFVRAEEEAPKTMLYPRDPSLDPQLVWKGKDEQDREDLAVPVVPIYIQEKIHPQALIEDLRAHSPLPAGEGQGEGQFSLYDDFNGVKDFRQKIDFYSHDLGTQPKWSNRMILGDSLLVMTSLAEKEGLKGKVQMIYMDPPYGIKFGSNWQVSTRKRDVSDGRIQDASRQPEQVKAFRDTWALGIHSYLSYLRDRLVVARELLTETGSAFLQIGDENVHLARSVMDEVFGSECHVVTILVKKKGGQRSSLIDPVNDYILWYSKAARNELGHNIKFRPLWERRALDAETLDEFRLVELPDGSCCSIAEVPSREGPVDYRLRPAQLFADHPGARLFSSNPLTSGGERRNQSLPFSYQGHTFEPGPGNSWKHTVRNDDGSPGGMQRLAWAGRLIAGDSTWRFKRFLDDFPFKMLSNWWDALGGAADPIYVVQTNTELVKRCLMMTTDPGDLVLDPTCGSGTTAVVAEQWGRRWITIDTSRVALALTRTRVMAARYPYYLLSDSPEGQEREAAVTGSAGSLEATAPTAHDVTKGFVYRRQPHVTSSSFANCPEIRKGMTTKQIEDVVRRQAEPAFLFDDPYEDGRRIRISGPFTVESLAPHRVLPTDDEQSNSELEGRRDSSAGQFERLILDNLKKAGVQTTRRAERLVFDRLEPFAGGWLQAAGEFKDALGKVRRVAVSIGPEHGTVGQSQIQEAAKEALKGIGFDMLLVLGFSFDAHASETASEASPRGLKPEKGFVGEWEDTYGKWPVLLVRMNPDLAMGDEILKKTGAGNLFMVFGEPDVEIEKQVDGRLVVQIKGVDVYDPTTGVIRSSSTDDIACWFLDTDYNEESFFVRHAYFTGAGNPYEKLRRALRAEINESAWSTLYSTVSRPFYPPATGKIAIKVINHFGDEVLKVYTVPSPSVPGYK